MSSAPIPNCPGYFASPDGRIFRGDVEVARSTHYNVGSKLSGYLTSWVLGKHRKVHRLVAQTFLDNPQNKPWVNHKDGDKSNNSVVNLEWSTPRENYAHAQATGLCKSSIVIQPLKDTRASRSKRGDSNPQTKVSDANVKLLFDWYHSGEFTSRELARQFNISAQTVLLIGRGKIRRDVTFPPHM